MSNRKTPDDLVEQIAAELFQAVVDFDLELGEFEALAGEFRRRVEDAIRTARVLVLRRLEEGGDE